MPGFISLLKAIGQGAVAALKFAVGHASQAAPVIQQVTDRYFPGGSAIITPIVAIISAVERAFAIAKPTDKSGPEKFQAALPLVEQVIKNSELVAGHEVADQSLLTRGAGKILDGVVDVLNSLKAPA